MEATLEADPQHIGPLSKVIGGQICRERLQNTSKSVTSASGLRRAYINQVESLIHYLAHGHLLSGAQISWDRFPEQWEIRNIFWLAQIILRSELKWSLQPTLEMWMQKDSFGRTSLLGLEFLTRSSETMVFSSIVRCSENTVANWGLLIGILFWLIPKGMSRLKL